MVFKIQDTIFMGQIRMFLAGGLDKNQGLSAVKHSPRPMEMGSGEDSGKTLIVGHIL